MTDHAGIVPLEGTTMHYEESGRGPAMVLVHAGIADRRMWGSQAREFSKGFRVVRPDLRGFGQTRRPNIPYSDVTDLEALLSALEISDAALVGSSMGGGVVLDLVLRDPDRVRAMVLAGATLSGLQFEDEATFDGWRAAASAFDRGDLEEAARIEYEMWVVGVGRPPNSVKSTVQGLVVDMLLASYADPEVEKIESDSPAIERLGEIAVPTLVLAGAHDRPDILRAADILAEEIAGARKVIVPRTAHLLNLERPATFNGILREFFDGL